MANQNTNTQSQVNPKKWWALIAVCLGLFMALLDTTIVNVALPSIQKNLQTDFSSLEWVINAYTLVFAVALIPSSRLGDVFGRKLFFILGVLVFTVGSILCGLASDILFLNISRGLQGLGASAMMSLSLAIISTTFFGKDRGLAFGIWGGVTGLATAIGPLIGGVLVKYINWQSIFHVNIPIGIITIFLAFQFVQETKDERASKSIDILGLILITLSMFSLVFGIIEINKANLSWFSPYILTLLITAFMGLIAFIIVELNKKYPMVDPRIFKNRNFTGASIAAFCVGSGMYALFFYLTIYLQNFLGFSALEAGLRFMAISVFALFLGPLSGTMTDKIGAKPIISISFGFLAISVFMMTGVSPSDESKDWIVLLPAFIVAGIGNGLINPPISNTAVDTVNKQLVGMASGVNNLCRQIGITLGTAFLGTILSNQYSQEIENKIADLNLQELSPDHKQAMINDIVMAGPIAGSKGLQGESAEEYRNMPGFSEIQEITRVSFVNSLDMTFITAGIVLSIGMIATMFFIKRR